LRRSRTIVVILAVLSVMLNAALVVRHGASMLEARFEHGALLAALGVICNSDGSAALPSGDSPDLPPLTPKSGDCPVCMGMCPTLAVLADVAILPPVLDQPSARVEVIAEIIRERTAGAWPPPRGPPAIV
jgi:hypothetical protein